MEHFFFYQVGTGEVVSTGLVPSSDLKYQIPPAGCAIALGRAELGQHYIGGELINQ